MRVTGLRLYVPLLPLLAVSALAMPPGAVPPKHPGHGAEDPGGGSSFVPQTLGPTTGAKGTAKATKITDDSGTFAFKAATGAEVAVKAVETDRARILWGSLTSFEYTLKVTDTVSRQVKTYTNPAGTFCGGMDEEGF